MKKNKASAETPYVRMFIESGILHFYYKKIDNLDLGVAQLCVKDRMEYTDFQDYPCLIDAISIKHFTKEARDYFANEGNEGIIASAILTSSTTIKMMANFYIMVNKPQNPTRMFTDKTSALEWLEQFNKQK
ncbi:DUF7793 family protein [Pontibacter populi]|uniref:DUF7793 domain-containing protein n=1 Tax=Pontibacter populi TaxID=890055 RepID=A0ABV1RTG7_9BACT